MPAIIYQTNKKTGITYVYESISRWDRKKQQSRARRKCIGKLDPVTGEIVPTRKRNRKEESSAPPSKRGPAPVTDTARYFHGATHLLDQISATHTGFIRCQP